MGSEAAPFLFGIPLVACLVVLLIFALTERKYSDKSERLLGLGRGRLARGYFGALGALLLVCVFLAGPERRVEVAVFYFFPVFGMLLVAFLTLLFLPILALLRRFGFASALGVVGAAAGVAGSIGLAFDGAFFSSMLGGAILALAFSVAANLPLVRSNAV
jgi:hypothetical protein